MNSSTSPVNLAICICTFRRPHLAKSLQSLTTMELPPSSNISVIVADNDDTPSAKALVEEIARDYPFRIHYLHAPARNISIARNACLDAATTPLVAFLDDDELVTTRWLTALIAQQQKNNADVVLGPVKSRYPEDSPTWILREDFHSIKPVWVKGKIITGYTSNALIKCDAPALLGLRFNPELGRTGGEDTAFFSAVHNAGGRLDYAPDAIVTEDVVPERLKFSWLLKRIFRSGQTHGMLLLHDKGASLGIRLTNFALAFAKCLFCCMTALTCLLTRGRTRYWVLRGTLHVGVMARLLGLSELVQYG